MMRLLRVAGLLAVLLVTVSLAACAPNSKKAILSPQLGEQLIAERASGQVAAPVAKEEVKLASLSPEQINAGLPDGVAAAMAAADPTHGQELSLANGCIGCHSLDPAQTMTGPTWYNIGDTAANRVAGVSPAFYLYDSVAAPNDHVVEGFPSGIMPQTYRDSLSDQDFADLISYLLAQNGK